MKRTCLLLVLLAACSFSCNKENSDGKDAGPPPNIVYIYMDDLGVEESAPYGHPIFETPNIARMAAEGVKFTRHYCGTSVCAPSRCALMTGKHVGHCAVRGNRQMDPHGQMPLPAAEVTVAEMLQGAGYETQLFGKWGLGSENTTGEPTNQGFDDYYGYLDQILAHNNFPEYLIRNGKKEMLKNEVEWQDSTAWHGGYGSYTKDPVEYSDDLFTEEAIKFIGQEHEKPFFVYLAYTIPHNNGEAPQDQRFQSPTLAPYEDKADWNFTEKSYAAIINRMDGYVGQVLAKLEEEGLAENTIVFFSSDNGSTEDIPEIFAASNKYRGMKRSPYEGGIRAPLIVWGKNCVPAGRTTDLLSAQWDFLPTACEIARVEPPANIDGISMWPAIMDKEQPREHDFLYWEFYEGGKWQAYRKGDHKLVYHHKADRYELYDLVKDPGEKNDLSGEMPELLATLKTELHAQHEPDPNWQF